jgi:hypothetical protein
MNNIELVERTQVQSVLDCTLNLFTAQAMEIMVDVLNKEQLKALKLSLSVIENISDSIKTKTEEEGKV